MYLRHKLQKTLLGKDEPKGVELEEVPAYLDKLDHVDVDADIFRETKIGKVLSRINKLENIPGEEKLGIKRHVEKLLAKWQPAMSEIVKKVTENEDSPSQSQAEQGHQASNADPDQQKVENEQDV